MNYSFENGTINSYPTRVIAGRDILEFQANQQVLIGHTLEYCGELESTLNEAISKAEGFYNRLVELGDIVPPKSAEEILQEQAMQQQEINANLLETIQKLSEKITRMEERENGPKFVSEHSEQSEQKRSNKDTVKSRKQTNARLCDTGSEAVLE